MTDLIERYVAAVARELPEAQRADIAAELRDELMSGLEAREEALGRPLARGELEAALVDFGNPLVVAGRYRRVQHLIGPEMFPFWWAALRAVLLVIAAIYLALAILVIVGGGGVPEVVERATPSIIETLIFAFGAVTLTCAAIERFGKPQVLARWKPANLPPAQGRARKRFDIMVEIAMGVVAILWWTGAVHFRNLLPGLWLRLDLAPVWTLWWWPILIYLTGELAMNVNALLQPGRVALNRSLAIARDLAGAAILLGVLQADRIVEVSAAHLSRSALAEIQSNVDRGFHVGLTVAILLFLAMAALEAWRLRASLRPQAA